MVDCFSVVICFSNFIRKSVKFNPQFYVFALSEILKLFYWVISLFSVKFPFLSSGSITDEITQKAPWDC